MKTLQFNTDLLAQQFSKNILHVLGQYTMQEMVSAHIIGNYAELDSCVSGDFLDSNISMAGAFRKLYGINCASAKWINNDIVIDAWNNAWNIAKENNFYFKVN